MLRFLPLAYGVEKVLILRCRKNIRESDSISHLLPGGHLHHHKPIFLYFNPLFQLSRLLTWWRRPNRFLKLSVMIKLFFVKLFHWSPKVDTKYVRNKLILKQVPAVQRCVLLHVFQLFQLFVFDFRKKMGNQPREQLTNGWTYPFIEMQGYI